MQSKRFLLALFVTALFFAAGFQASTANAWFHDTPGSQHGIESVNSTFMSVTFATPFSNTPLVFAEIQSENESDDAQVVIAKVTTTGFQMRIEEDGGAAGAWLDRTHAYEDVAWTAIDPNEITPGQGIEAGIAYVGQRTPRKWTTVTLTESYSSTPIVLTQIQTKRSTVTVRPDIRNVTTTSFEIRLEEDMGNGITDGWDGIHAIEPVAYFVFDPSTAPINRDETAGTQDVDDQWTSICFLSDCSDFYAEEPEVFVEIQSENERDTAQADIQNITTSGFEVRLEELDTAGWDGTHAVEQVSWLASGSPASLNILIADTVASPASSGVAYIVSILEAAGHTVTQEEPADIIADGSIDSSFDLMVYPGGTDPVSDATDATLQGIVQDFVSNGGGFIGICGGAIAGSDNLTIVDYYPYTYSVSMLGVGTGVTANYDTSWASYLGHAIFPNFQFTTDHEITGASYSAGDSIMMTYAGGPVFNVDSSVTVIATYTITLSGSSYSSMSQPAVVETSYGDGSVILFAPHPEYNAVSEFLLENAALYVAR